eukprot:scaffold1228_cov115-Isochrysis_galbana.AAC.12
MSDSDAAAAAAPMTVRRGGVLPRTTCPVGKAHALGVWRARRASGSIARQMISAQPFHAQ